MSLPKVLRHHHPRFAQLHPFGLRRPHSERQVEYPLACRARLAKKAGHAVAATLAAAHLAPLEANAGALGHAVIDTDFLVDSRFRAGHVHSLRSFPSWHRRILVAYLASTEHTVPS